MVAMRAVAKFEGRGVVGDGGGGSGGGNFREPVVAHMCAVGRGALVMEGLWQQSWCSC